jgi:hypothetical protein
VRLVVYRFGGFNLHPGTFELSPKGRRLRLEWKPLELLVLPRHHGQVVNREQIAQCLWTQESSSTSNTESNTAIRKLRQTLADSSDQPGMCRPSPALQGASHSASISNACEFKIVCFSERVVGYSEPNKKLTTSELPVFRQATLSLWLGSFVLTC